MLIDKLILNTELIRNTLIYVSLLSGITLMAI